MRRFRASTVQRTHEDVNALTMALRDGGATDASPLPAYVCKHGVAHLLTVGRVADAEARMLDVVFMSAFIRAWDDGVQPLVSWRVVGLDKADEGWRRTYAARPDDDATLDRAQHALVVAEFIVDCGLYDAAACVGAWALDVIQRHVGTDHSWSFTASHVVASAYLSAGRLEAAERIAGPALDASERTSGADGDSTNCLVSTMAQVLWKQGRLTEAEPLCVRALEVTQRLYGPDHPNAMRDLNNLAGMRNALGQHDEAERLHRLALEAKERRLGPDHPSTLTSAANVANCLTNAQRHEEAYEMYARVSGSQARVLGPEHPSTLATILAQGRSALALGRAEAEDMLIGYLDASARVLGAAHPGIVRASLGLASRHAANGRVEEALPFLVRALEGADRLAPHAPEIDVLFNLSWVFAALCVERERADHAERVLRLAAASGERTLGVEHPVLLHILQQFAELLCALGRPDDAVKPWMRVIDARVRVLGVAHEDTCAALASMASAPDPSRGPAMWERALAAVRSASGREGAELLPAYEAVAESLVRAGRPAAALGLLETSVEWRVTLHGSEAADNVPALWGLAQCLRAVGRPGDASVHRGACWRLEASLYGATALATLQTAVTLTDDLTDAGDPEGARAVAVHTVSLARAEPVLGEDDERAPWLAALEALV
jgi:tetratricopeptide (TPR) repeat protein